jgi:hypothetical protein
MEQNIKKTAKSKAGYTQMHSFLVLFLTTILLTSLPANRFRINASVDENDHSRSPDLLLTSIVPRDRRKMCNNFVSSNRISAN